MNFNISDAMIDDLVERAQSMVNQGIHPADAIQQQYKRMQSYSRGPNRKRQY